MNKLKKGKIVLIFMMLFVLSGCSKSDESEAKEQEKELLKLQKSMVEYQAEDGTYTILLPNEKWSVVKQEESYISFASKDVGTISIRRLEGEEAASAAFPVSTEEATNMILNEGISQDRFELVDFGQETENTVKMEVCLKVDENTDMYEFITLNKVEDVLYKKIGMVLDNQEETMKLVQLSMDSYQEK